MNTFTTLLCEINKLLTLNLTKKPHKYKFSLKHTPITIQSIIDSPTIVNISRSVFQDIVQELLLSLFPEHKIQFAYYNTNKFCLLFADDNVRDFWWFSHPKSDIPTSRRNDFVCFSSVRCETEFDKKKGGKTLITKKVSLDNKELADLTPEQFLVISPIKFNPHLNNFNKKLDSLGVSIDTFNTLVKLETSQLDEAKLSSLQFSELKRLHARC